MLVDEFGDQDDWRNREVTTTDIERATEAWSSSSPWGDPVRLARYLARLMADRRVPRGAKLKVAAAGLYVWVDGDLVPDPIRMIPGIGYVDDLILVVHGVACLVRETDDEVARELWPGDRVSYARTMRAVGWVDEQLYGRVRNGVRRLWEKLVGREAGKAEVARR